MKIPVCSTLLQFGPSVTGWLQACSVKRKQRKNKENNKTSFGCADGWNKPGGKGFTIEEMVCWLLVCKVNRILSKTKYGQVQYPNHRSYNFVWQADVIMKYCSAALMLCLTNVVLQIWENVFVCYSVFPGFVEDLVACIWSGGGVPTTRGSSSTEKCSFTSFWTIIWIT